MSRVVQVANFVTPTSGGLRTALRALATGYAAAGHEVVQVLPGTRERVTRTPWGRRVELPGRPVPGTGYRVHPSPARVRRALAALRPDRLEVHDRTTLRGLGCWAAAAGVPSLVVSHERLDRWLATVLPVLRGPAADRLADTANARLAAGFDTVVCTTGWAAAEFARLGVPVQRVPLGVDAGAFRPDRAARPGLAGDAEVLLVLASRLSREKRPELAVGAVAELTRRGRRVRLVVAGDGPLRRSLTRRAAGLPVTFLGHVPDRAVLAGVLGAADAVLAPGPVETFGLAALEAAACGTPVVAHRDSALPSVLGAAGLPAAGSPAGLADAVEELLAGDERVRRARARARAEELPWSATVAGFLGVHGLARGAGVPA
ncbi:glycosyltransferase [Geodermatophilus sp. SYSU D00758]